MEIHAHTPARRPRRALAAFALFVALLTCGALSAAALARPARSGHRSSCATARHAKHVKHCAKAHGKKTHGGAHKSRKPAAKPAPPAPKLTAAVCEDGTSPARSADGAYSCEDGSEPACEDGSDPIRPSSSSAPMCRVPHEEAPKECGVDPNGECGPEFVCEDVEEAGSAPQGCEHGSAFEEEEPEA